LRARWSITDESLPIEYIITGLRAPATASRMISMASSSSWFITGAAPRAARTWA
jgi:hypothetical protein